MPERPDDLLLSRKRGLQDGSSRPHRTGARADGNCHGVIARKVRSHRDERGTIGIRQEDGDCTRPAGVDQQEPVDQIFPRIGQAHHDQRPSFANGVVHESHAGPHSAGQRGDASRRTGEYAQNLLGESLIFWQGAGALVECGTSTGPSPSINQ